MSFLSRPVLLLLFGLLFTTICFSALTTQVPLWLTHQSLAVWQVGLVGSSYFVGNLVGTIVAGWLINLFGFRSAYNYACALFALATIGLGFSFDFVLWMGWRFLAGVGCAVIWVTVESSLLRAGTIKTRGKLLAAYMFIYYLGSVAGQLVLKHFPSNMSYFILCIVTLMVMAMLPLLFTRLQRPVINDNKPEIWPMIRRREARLGVIGCMISGIILGSIYGLLPVYLAKTGISDNDVANWMAFLIAAGIIAQLPIGWLADKYGRLMILRIQAVLIFVSSLAIMFDYWPIISLLVLGAFSFTQYPIAMAWACERVSADEVVAMNQALLLSYTIGSLLGPSIVALLMQYFTIALLFVAISIVALAYLLLLLSKMGRNHTSVLPL